MLSCSGTKPLPPPAINTGCPHPPVLKPAKLDPKASPGQVLKTISENASIYKTQAVIEAGTVKCYEETLNEPRAK